VAIHQNNSAGASGVRIVADRIHFNNIVLDAPTAVRILQGFPPDEWHGVVIQMLEHGAHALESAYTNATLQLVAQQLEGTVTQMQQVMLTTFTQGWETTATALQKMLTEHQKALNAYLDANSKTGLQAQMAEVFNHAGQTLFQRVAQAFAEGDESALGRYLTKFKQEVQTGFAAVAAQQAVKHHRETATTLSGLVYEEATLVALTEITRCCGDVVEHCGATFGELRKRNGDILVTVSEDMARGNDLRIVYELKRRSDGGAPFSVATMRRELRAAKENRGGHAAVFLVETAELLPAGSGTFIELGGGDYATVYTPDGSTLGLSVAHRLARLYAITSVAANGDEAGVDIEAAQRAVAEIRQGMSRLAQIRSQHNAAIGAINRAGTAAQELVDLVLEWLRRLDDILDGE